MLKNKKIILGISGSIAAYKAAFLTRLFIKAGAEVKVLMTPTAKEFITPLTLSTLSKNPVFSEVASEDGWNNHVDLGLWADAMIVAPATATTLAKMANGICDNIITAVYLSARCPVFIAPAMDLDMWEHPATQNNIRLLTNYKNHIIPVEHGELASGLVGNGRMAEPENILTFLHQYFSNEYISKDLTGKKVLITSGPTYEPIDPVRFIGNRSSGKMGIAIADEMAKRGAEVTVVSGPSRILPQEKSVKIIKVESAQNMYETSRLLFPDVDIAVLAAAVADYTPSQVANQKIKKQGDELTIELKKTPDIAKELGAIKKNNQFIIGFALETNNEFSNAKEKLEKKNFDFIVLNSLQDAGAGFHHDTNKITIIDKTETLKYDLKTKAEVAKDITDLLVSRLKHKLI